MAACLLPGCFERPGNYFSQYRQVGPDGWKYGKSLVFVPQFPDSVAHGRMAVAATHSAQYPYDALWLEIRRISPVGAVLVDTVRLGLADGYGGWRGTGIGPELQLADTLRQPVTLVSGSPVKVRHIMQTDTLRGIEQIGLFFMPD